MFPNRFCLDDLSIDSSVILKSLDPIVKVICLIDQAQPQLVLIDHRLLGLDF